MKRVGSNFLSVAPTPTPLSLSLLLLLLSQTAHLARSDDDPITAMAAERGAESWERPILHETTAMAALFGTDPSAPTLRREDDSSSSSSFSCSGAIPLPGVACDVSLYDGLTCHVRHAWTGCTEETMSCFPAESCTCNRYDSGRWECASFGAAFCDDPSSVPDRRGGPCDPSTPPPEAVIVDDDEEEPPPIPEDPSSFSCEDAMVFPGSACDVSGVTCETRYAWSGCTEDAMACLPSESCTCTDRGSWRCVSMGMAQCADPASAPAQRGSSCTLSPVIEDATVPNDPAVPSEETTATTATPVSFYGLNYNTRKGPDWAADRERCKSRAEVVRDLRLLSRITTRLRILSMRDCDQGALVWSVLGRELSGVPMEVWLGLWVGPDEQVFIDEYDALAAMLPEILASDRSRLSGITVGSEAIYREDVTVDRAIQNLESTRALLAAYGMSGDVPVAIVDIAPIYSNDQQLRLASDVIMTNTFPFWEGLPVELAVDELEIDLGWLVDLPEARGKPFVLSEHGWPSGGFLDGVGIASPENQKRYLRESHCYLLRKGWPNYFFTAIDNDWRQQQDPNNTIEGNWGFLDASGRLKDHLVGFEFDCPHDGSTHSFASVDWTVPELPADDDPVDPAEASCGLWRGCELLAGDCCPTPGGDYLGCCRDELFLGDRFDEGTSSNNVVPATESPTTVAAVVPVVAPPTAPTDAPSPTRSPTESPIIPGQSIGILTPPATPAPTVSPSTEPPTLRPTRVPTNDPTVAPTRVPTNDPTVAPTRVPTESPTRVPTDPPVEDPTAPPTNPPTVAPTGLPTRVSPADSPLPASTDAPTEGLSKLGSRKPTGTPTAETITDASGDGGSSSSSGLFPPWEDIDDNEGDAVANGVSAGESSGGRRGRFGGSATAAVVLPVATGIVVSLLP